MGHLEELRIRLIRSFLAIGIGVFVGYFFAPMVVEMLLKPYKDSGLLTVSTQEGIQIEVREDGTLNFENFADFLEKTSEVSSGTPSIQKRIEFHRQGEDSPFVVLDPVGQSGVVYLRVLDPVIVQFKTAGLLGFILAIPYILWEVYQFVSPGLYPQERRSIMPVFWAASVLFPLGVLFAYFSMKYAFMFFGDYAAKDVIFLSDIRAYLSFALTTLIVFGVLFEMPIIILLLSRLGVIDVESLAGKRKFIFVGILILSAILTPPDPFTMLLMGLPLYCLFEVGLLISRFGGPKTASQDEFEHGQP